MYSLSQLSVGENSSNIFVTNKQSDFEKCVKYCIVLLDASIIFVAIIIMIFKEVFFTNLKMCRSGAVIVPRAQCRY